MAIINGGYREYKLDNGLVVALQKTPTQTIVGELRVNFGSSHEREDEEGMAHFLEHCLLTGGSLKYDPIHANKIRGYFSYSNASASIGKTKFVAYMLSEYFKNWLDYVSDYIFNPRFDQEKFKGERNRVLREISDTKSNPSYIINREFQEALYRGHPMGMFILGKEEVVSNATEDRIRDFHNRGYSPNNMDLIIVGDLPENIDDLVRDYFGNFLMGDNTRRDFPELKPLMEKTVLYRSAPEKINVDNPDESSAQIFLCCLGPVDGHPDDQAVRTMGQILGGDVNSLLFQNVSLKKGLAYSINVNKSGTYNAGVLEINASVPARRIDESADAIFEEIQRIKTERVDDESVERIKRISKYNLVSTLESNAGHVEAIEYKLDKGLTFEEFTQGYNNVTPDKILEVANEYLPTEEGNYVLCIIDPLKK